MTIPLRTRLTLWCVGVLAVVLIAFSAGVLWLQNHYSRSLFDSELASVAQTMSSVMREELGESHRIARAAAETRSAVDIPNRTVAVLDANGKTLAAHWRGFRSASIPAANGRSSSVVATVMQNNLPWRIRMLREDSADGPYTIVVAASEQPLTRERHVLEKSLLVGTPAALLLAAIVCWWATSRALRPLTDMSDRAEQITLRSLHAPLPGSDTRDEIGQLGRAFNRLFARVASAVESQRQFMADASHELRTPVAAARTAAEVTLTRPHRREREYREALTIVLNQTRRLGRMVDDMLVLARADVGGYPVRLGACELAPLLADCVDTARVIAAPSAISVESHLEDGIRLRADDALLRHLALNLLENAVKHTPSAGSVRLSLHRVNGHVEIAVVDSGCGIPVAERDRVFERFVRLDAARENSGGAGLGLPIARWIAEAHGGTLTLDASGPTGSTFVARLPIG